MKSNIRPHALAQFREIPRCGAKTRNGNLCQNPCVKGRPRCRMHGCAPGSGGQPGNKNAWKHGRRSREAILNRNMRRNWSNKIQEMVEELKELLSQNS